MGDNQSQETLNNHDHIPPMGFGPESSTASQAHDQEEKEASDSDSDSDVSFYSAEDDPITVGDLILRRAPTSLDFGFQDISATIKLLTEHGCDDISARIDGSFWNHSRHGAFGDVFKASLLDGAQVAIKTLKFGDDLGSDERSVLKKAARELYTWRKCQHPNVLSLLGVAIFRGKVAMVSPWATNGTLQEYIQDNVSVNRCSLSTQVSDGLVYLHDNGTVHGDLKANNVMVSETGVPMIGDFGHAFLDKCSLPITTTSHSAIGTLRWTPPEIIKQEAVRSFAGDVYSLGMTILEILTGKVPYHETEYSALYHVIVHQGKFPPRPESQIPPGLFGNMLWALLVSCWSRKVQERPSATQVRDVMKTFTPEKLKRRS